MFFLATRGLGPKNINTELSKNLPQDQLAQLSAPEKSPFSLKVGSN